ncbi:MAG: DUF58 domain-containing protein, partial [Phycisphaeraceae bacterium]|nr:DUF58 domain-containing protein [Phycisphaeraceae bacterium]
ILIAIGLIVGGALSMLPATGLTILAAIVFDGLLLRLRCRSAIGSVAGRLDVSSEAADGSILVGGTCRLEMTIVNRGRRCERLELVPLLPAGIRAIDHACVWIVLERGEKRAVSLRYRIGSVGSIVFPGVLLRRWSMLRLFRDATLMTGRTEVTALPNFASSDHPVVARFLRADAPGGEMNRGRALKGQGTEFCELRAYQPPDPMRRVDWKATARKANPVVRTFEAERSQTVVLAVDAGRLMT